MVKILIIHGPNLSLLGEREPDIYGTFTLDEINSELKEIARGNNADIEFFQSDSEGDIVSKIGKAREEFDLVIINPAGYTHTSVAIRDAIEASALPAIEVHLSNIYAREEFRSNSLIAPVCRGQISGFGKNSYLLALEAALKILNLS
ncbi:MAG: type II 3-dehydroquinate dehydratase [Candidatus Kaelpia imicola]|nr:type II 3-dehydroquinate dehydratase [Candidatus Kaelpia imicola]